jgi:hypothetical protein
MNSSSDSVTILGIYLETGTTGIFLDSSCYWALIGNMRPSNVATPMLNNSKTAIVSKAGEIVQQAWRTKTISGAKLVLLGIEWWTAGAGDSAYFYTRKNGSAQTWEGILRSTTGDYGGGQGSMILQPCDGDGKYQYKGGIDSGTLTVRRIGYFS